MRILRNTAAISAAVLFASTALASRDPFVTTAYTPAPHAQGGETATALTTGFEAPFVPGQLNLQQGWTVSTVSGVPVTSVNVATANPKNGVQHVRETDTTNVANGGVVGAFSANLPQPANDASVTSVDVFINDPGGADYRVQGQSPAQGFISWRVDFDFLNNINVVDFSGTALALVDTGFNWAPGVYQNLTVSFVPGGPAGTPPTAPAGTIVYKLNGATIYTADTLVAATATDQVLFLNDSFQVANGFGDFDNLTVTAVPEPTSLGLLGVGAIAAFRRRRRA